jgi:hypothetical protein
MAQIEDPKKIRKRKRQQMRTGKVAEAESDACS